MIAGMDLSPWSVDAAVDRFSVDEDLPSDTWHYQMEDYSERNLTYATDRLPAVSGMAARFHASRRCNYYAGLWADDLPRSLGWYCTRWSDGTSADGMVWHAPLNNGVPSWSWASISGKIAWPHLMLRMHTSHLIYPHRFAAESQLLQVKCEPATQNKFGKVSAGSFVKLRGKIVEAVMECDGVRRGFVRRDGFAPQLVVPDCELALNSAELTGSAVKYGTAVLTSLRRADESDSDHVPTLKIQGNVACMLLYSVLDDGRSGTDAFVLVLGKLGMDDTSYERIAAGTRFNGPCFPSRKDTKQLEGWSELEEWECWECWESWFAGAETRDVCMFWLFVVFLAFLIHEQRTERTAIGSLFHRMMRSSRPRR